MTLKPLNGGELTLLSEGNIFQIKPTFSPTEKIDPSFDLFLVSLEQFIEKILPKNILDDLKNFPSEKTIENAFRQLNYALPVFNYSFSKQIPHTISVGLLCLSDYTSGVGRYLNDMMSRWIIPGKHLPVVSCRSLEFYFIKCPKYQYYLHENYVRISNEEELSLVKNKISNYLNELRINILAVKHARYVVSIKSLSYEEKNAMIQENISSLLKIPNNFIDQNLFDQMQNLLIKTSSDEKIKEVEKVVSNLMQKKPKFFNRDIFYEIRDLLFQLKDQFIFEKDAKYLSRIIGYQYLFKKTILRKINQNPNERHLSLKLFRTKQARSVSRMGILITMNLLSETERFERKHILEAICSIINNIQYVKDSCFSDKNNENIPSFYFEIEKNNYTKFSFDEFKRLKAKLPKEIKSRIENVVHSTFMPRNEEEIIRNIVILSKQLRYVKDIPQVIISYNRQTSTQLSFTVILVRLIKNNTKKLSELLISGKNNLQFVQDESKIIGYLKKKYPKEANVFRVFVEKYAFFRPNYSLNLQKARQYIVSELMNLIGDFRDYNGGMILKQHETLTELRKLLSEEGYEGHYLIENFFYSIKPGIMQSILTARILKMPFLMLNEAVENDYDKKPLFTKYMQDNNHLFVTIASENSSFKIFIKNSLSQLNISSFDLTSSTVKVYDIYITSYIFKSHDKNLKEIFLKNIIDTLNLWSQSTCKNASEQ